MNKKEFIKGLVSIIIPVYNKERYIDTCIKMINQQTYHNFEVIMVDDGSKDNSPEICDNLAKQYDWISVYHTPNRGVSSARNFGIEKAKGEWMTFVDVDDYPLPEMLQQMVKEQASLVVCNWKDEKREFCSQHFTEKRKVCNIVDDNVMLFCTPDYFKTVWNKLYKLSIIEANSIRYEESICHAEDALFSIDYLSALTQSDKIVLLGEPLYFHLADVKGSLVKDKHPERWKLSAKYWWKHIEKANLSEESRQNMLLRCLQNDFLVCAMERNYSGVVNLLQTKGNIINKESLKHWGLLKKIVLGSKNALIIYLVNRLWLRVS